jgi:hypothetical protein
LTVEDPVMKHDRTMPALRRCAVPVLLLAALAGAPRLQAQSSAFAVADRPPVAIPHFSGPFRQALDQADLIAIATVVEIDASPECWNSADEPCVQEVELRLDTVWRGELKSEQRVEAEFELVQGSALVSALGPWLDDRLFAQGERIIVFLERVPEDDNPGSRPEQELVWRGFHPDGSALPLEVSESVRRQLGL